MENSEENIQMIELPRLHPSAYNWLYNSCTILSLAEYVKEDDFLTPPPTPLVPPNSPAEGVRPRSETIRTYGTTSWETPSFSKEEAKERSRWLESLTGRYVEERPTPDPAVRPTNKRYKVRDEIAAWELWRTRMLAFRAPDPPFLFPLRMHPLPPFESRPESSMQAERSRMSPSDSYYTPSLPSSTSPFLRRARLLDVRSSAYTAPSVDTLRTLGNVESLQSEYKMPPLLADPKSSNDLMRRSFHWKERKASSPRFSPAAQMRRGGDEAVSVGRRRPDSPSLSRAWSTFHESTRFRRKKRLLEQLRGSVSMGAGGGGKSVMNPCLDGYIALLKDTMALDEPFPRDSTLSVRKSEPVLKTAAHKQGSRDTSRKKRRSPKMSREKENEDARIITRSPADTAIIRHENMDYIQQSVITKSPCTYTYGKSTEDDTPQKSPLQKNQSTSPLGTAMVSKTSSMDTCDPIQTVKPMLDENEQQHDYVLLKETRSSNKQIVPSYMTNVSNDRQIGSDSYQTWPHSPFEANRKKGIQKKSKLTGPVEKQSVEKKITVIKEILHQPPTKGKVNEKQDNIPNILAVCARESSSSARSIGSIMEKASPPIQDKSANLSTLERDLSLTSIVAVKRKKLLTFVPKNKTKDSEPTTQTKRKEANVRQISAGTKKAKSVPRGKLKESSLKENHRRKIQMIQEFDEFSSSAKEESASDISIDKDCLKKRLRALKIGKINCQLSKVVSGGAVLPTFTHYSDEDEEKKKHTTLKISNRKDKTIDASTKIAKDKSGSPKSNISEQKTTEFPTKNQHASLINYIHHIKMNSSSMDKNDFLTKLRNSIQKRPGFGDAKTRLHHWRWNEEQIIYQSPDEVSDMTFMSEYFRKRRDLKPVKGGKRKPQNLVEKLIRVHDLQVRVPSHPHLGDSNLSVSDRQKDAQELTDSDEMKTVSTPIDNASNLRQFILPEQHGRKSIDTMEKFKNIHKLRAIGSAKNVWKLYKESKKRAKCLGFPSPSITTIKEYSDDPTKSLYLSEHSANLFSDDEKSTDVEAKVEYWPEKSDDGDNAPKEFPKYKSSRPFYWPNDPRKQLGSNRFGIDVEETHPQFNTCIRSRTDLSVGNKTELLDNSSIQIIKGSNNTEMANLTEDPTDLSLSFTFSDSSSIHRLDSAVEGTEIDSLTEINNEVLIATTRSSLTDEGTHTSHNVADMNLIETQLTLTPSQPHLSSLISVKPPSQQRHPSPQTPLSPSPDKTKEAIPDASQLVIAKNIDDLRTVPTHTSANMDGTVRGLLFEDGQWTLVPASPPLSAGLRDKTTERQAIRSLSQEWRLDVDRKPGSPKSFHGYVPGIRHVIFGGKKININDYKLNASYPQILSEYQKRSASTPNAKITPNILRAFKRAFAKNKKTNMGVTKFPFKRPSSKTPKASTTRVKPLPPCSIPKEVGPGCDDRPSSLSNEPQTPLRTSAHGIIFPSTIVVQRMHLGKVQSREQSRASDTETKETVDTKTLAPVEHLPQNPTLATPRKKRPRRKPTNHEILETLEEEPQGDGACLVAMTLPQRMSLSSKMATPCPSPEASCVGEDLSSPVAKKFRVGDQGVTTTTHLDKQSLDGTQIGEALRCATDEKSNAIQESQNKIGDHDYTNALVQSQPGKHKSFPGAMGNLRSKYHDRPHSPLSMIPETSACHEPPKSSESTGSPRTSLHSKNVSRREKRMSSRGTEKLTTATSEIVIAEEDSMSTTSLTNCSLRRFSMFSNGNQYWPDGSRHNECLDGSWQLEQYREATQKAWKMIAQGKQQSQQKLEFNKQKATMTDKSLSIKSKPASCIEYLKRRLEEEEKRLHHLATRKKRHLGTTSMSHTSTLLLCHRNLPSTVSETSSRSDSLFPLQIMNDAAVPLS